MENILIHRIALADFMDPCIARSAGGGSYASARSSNPPPIPCATPLHVGIAGFETALIDFYWKRQRASSVVKLQRSQRTMVDGLLVFGWRC